VSRSSVGIVWVAGLLVLVALVFGARDAWGTARGVNGTWAGGFVIALFALVPVACVLGSILRSHRENRDLVSTLSRASRLGIAISVPVALVLVVGAAY